MANATVQKTRINQTYWTKKEASYDDVVGVGEAGSISTEFDGMPFKRTGRFERGDQVGRGHDFNGTVRKNNGWSTDVSRSVFLDSENAGILACFGLGTVSTGADGTGYRHTAKPLALSSSPQLPSMTIAERQEDETLYRLISGVCIDNFTISGNADEWIQAQYALIGSGNVTSASGLTPPTLTKAQPFLFSEISLATVGAASGTNLIDRLRSFSLKWNNKLKADKGYLAGSSLVDGAPVRQRLEMSERGDDGCTLDLTFERTRSAYQERTDFEASTSWVVTIKCIGSLISSTTYHEFKITIPVAKIDDYDPDWDNGSGIAKVVLKPDYDTGISAPLKLEVVNARSSYLTAAA